MRAGGCPDVIAQWQNTGCTSQVSWVQFPATAGLLTFLYFHLTTSKFSLFQHDSVQILSKIYTYIVYLGKDHPMVYAMNSELSQSVEQAVFIQKVNFWDCKVARTPHLVIEKQ